MDANSEAQQQIFLDRWNQVNRMTATMPQLASTKTTSSPRAAAIDRIHVKLDAMVNRLRRETWLVGGLAIGTASVMSLLITLMIDAIFQPESVWLRVALWIPMMGVVGVVTQIYLMLPLKQKCDRLAMAWDLEQKQPAIEERLTTSLQLNENLDAKTNSIIEAVAEQAHGSLAGCPEEDFRGQEVFTRAIVAGISLAAFVLSMWFWAPYLIPSLQNVLNPWSARVLPHLNATIDPGDTHVGQGSDLRVTATARYLADAVLEVIENDAVVASHQMATVENGRAADFTLTGLQHEWQYRVRSGNLYSDRYQIIVDPKPIIKSSHVRLTFPEYTQLSPQIINDLAAPIEVLYGTQIRIDVDSTMPAAESSLRLNGASIACEDSVAIKDAGLWRHSWDFTATAGESQRGTITLVSEAGVQSDPQPLEIRVLSDLPPSIIIDQPALSEIIAKPDGSIHVVYHGVDDFGCSKLQLTTLKNSEAPASEELPHDLRAEFGGESTIELNELDLKPGDQLIVWLSIFDNRPNEYGGPQSADSQKIRVQIADGSIPVGQQVVRNEMQSLLAELTEALDQLHAAADISDKLKADLGEMSNTAKPSEDPADAVAMEKVKHLQDRIKNAEQALRRLSEPDELAPQRLFQEEIERIQEVTENDVVAAKKQAGLVPLSDELGQQQEAIAATDESLRDAIDKLERVRADVEGRGKQMEMAAKLDELAKQQERLAQRQREGRGNAPDVQQKQQQVADELQEVVDQDLDAKSEQFSQRAETAAKLTNAAAELQKQQETLAKLDQIRNKEELDEELLEMIAREQEQIAKETQVLEEQRRDIQPPAADVPDQVKKAPSEATEAEPKPNPNALAKARKQMEAVPGKLRQKDLEQAEIEAQQACVRLREEANSVPEKAAAKSKANVADKANVEGNNAKDVAQQKGDDLGQLAKQQERVLDAIKAIREDRPEEAVAKLQEQIADRTERLRDKANELLQLPTEDLENQQAVREAREKLEQAERDTKAAEAVAKEQRKQAGTPKQDADPKQAADPKQVGDPEQAGDPKKADDSKQAADPKQADDPKQVADAKQAGDPKQAADPKQAGDPKEVDDSKKADDPKQAAEHQQQAVEQQEQAAEQQKQAAKSLQEATQSLDKVCKSCKKCSNCNKSGGSSGSSGSSSKSGGNSSKANDSKSRDSKPGDSQPGDSKPGDSKPVDSQPGDSKQGASNPGVQSNESGNASRKQQPDSQNLAATADKAHQTARNPSPDKTQQLAQELNELADEAAQQAGYPNRKNSKPQGGQSKSPNASDSTQPAGAPQPGDPSKPQGVQGNAGAGQSEVVPTQLRGRSTSNWTQSRRKLKNSVLDDQDSKIPEEFRSVVKDYFEELSRLESRQNAGEKDE